MHLTRRFISENNFYDEGLLIMARGISLFLGMDYSLADNLEYIKNAHQAGFRQIFTSLHIPEADYAQIISQFEQVLNLAKQLEMRVIADISPNAYGYLGIAANDLGAFKRLGLSGIRLDYGFKPEQIAEYSNNSAGLLIELNASTATADFITQIMAAANPANLSACHNYYPRKNTGIGVDALLRKNALFKHYNIPVSAFIALTDAKRGPLYEGLPTLEFTREMSPRIAGQILLQLGIDNLCIGDACASEEILAQIGQLETTVIELELAKFSSNPCYAELLGTHTNRPDAAEDVVRSQESRLMLLENSYVSRKINPECCTLRPRGSVCVDNLHYLRYSGELQICKCDLPADQRVNLVGELTADSCYLLDYIGDNQQFKLILR